MKTKQMTCTVSRGHAFLAWAALSAMVAANGSAFAQSVQLPLPTKTGEVFMVDHFDFKVTLNDMGVNFNSGNMGEINDPEPALNQAPIIFSSWSTNSNGSVGGSWMLTFDFTGYPVEAFCGVFLSLSGLTDTLVELAVTGVEPTATTVFTNHCMNFDNIYGEFVPWTGRSIDRVAFDARLAEGSDPVTVKVELKDGEGWDVFTRVPVSSQNWVATSLQRSTFTPKAQTVWARSAARASSITFSGSTDCASRTSTSSRRQARTKP